MANHCVAGVTSVCCHLRRATVEVWLRERFRFVDQPAEQTTSRKDVCAWEWFGLRATRVGWMPGARYIYIYIYLPRMAQNKTKVNPGGRGKTFLDPLSPHAATPPPRPRPKTEGNNKKSNQCNLNGRMFALWCSSTCLPLVCSIFQLTTGLCTWRKPFTTKFRGEIGHRK